MIRIRNVSKTFHSKEGNIEALNNVSLEVDQGDIYGVIGFSGAGKSTLIRLVNQLETNDSGEVEVNGVDVKKASSKELRKLRKNIGMIFQQFNLLDTRNVYENIAMPLILEGWKKEKIEARVKELLQFIGLEDRGKTPVNKLSGGQKQRVGIARALALNPSILLCDEATSALDPRTTESILQLLKTINRELGVTILLITHEMSVISKICNKVAVMEDGEIVEQGEVIDVFSNPKSEIARNFVQTVISDRIPEEIFNSLKKEGGLNNIIKLTFKGENAKSALVSEINKEYDLKTTILFASVNEIQNQILGVLILRLKGSQEEIDKALDYIRRTDVKMEEVNVND